MQAKLVGKTGDLAGKEFLISRELTIGKRGDNTIALHHRFVSRRHARIYFDAKKECYFLEDLKSQNGTNLDGEQIHKRERLANIHIITIGKKFDFFFVVIDAEEPSSLLEVREPDTNTATRDLDPDKGNGANNNKITIVKEDFALAKNSARSNRANLVEQADAILNEAPQRVTHGSLARPGRNGKSKRNEGNSSSSSKPDSRVATKSIFQARPVSHKKTKTGPGLILNIKGFNKKVALAEGLNVIGRTAGCDVVIDDETVSRQHACISVQKDAIQLNDLDSKNRTFIDNRAVQSATNISPDTQIKFGDVEVLLTRA